jgi:hypothetical protein
MFSHSHRGFSPVIWARQKEVNRFNGLLRCGCMFIARMTLPVHQSPYLMARYFDTTRKPLKRFASVWRLDHRAKAAV